MLVFYCTTRWLRVPKKLLNRLCAEILFVNWCFEVKIKLWNLFFIPPYKWQIIISIVPPSIPFSETRYLLQIWHKSSRLKDKLIRFWWPKIKVCDGHSIFVNLISQKHLKGILLHLQQILTWTGWWPDEIFKFTGHRDLTKQIGPIPNRSLPTTT